MMLPSGPYIKRGLFVSGLLLALFLSACGGPDSTPTVETRPTGTATAEPPAQGQGGSATDQGSLIETLRKTFPAITPTDTINQPFMSVPATDLRLADEKFPTLQVYEYPDEAAAQKDASKIQPNGDIPGYHVGWIAQAHFYRSGRIIVIYLGKDPTILSALESAVGKPFAIGEDVPSPGTPKP